MGRVILAAGLILALVLLGLRLAVKRDLRARWPLVVVATAFSWAAFFGICRLVAYLTQRDLPEASFTTPVQFYAGASVPLALAVALGLRGRAKTFQLLLAESGLLIACLALNYRASFTDDAILLRPCGGFTERRYRYDQVKSVRQVIDQRIGPWAFHHPRFVITFDDGKRWTTDDGFRRTSYPMDANAMAEVSSRAGRMLQQVQTE